MAQGITINLHARQDEAIFAPERFVAVISGIQGGKTTAGAVWSRIQSDAHRDDDGLIGAPTYKILQQSTLPKFFALNPDYKAFYKKSDNVIELPNRKGKIYIRSLDEPNSIEGMTLRWVWLDEAGQMSYDAWINAQGRVSILRGKILLTTTPYNMGWLFSQFYENCRKGVPDYRVVQFRSIDSPFFPREEYERAKKTMDGRIFRRRYEGQFERMEGLVYDDFNYNFHVIDTPPCRDDEYDYMIAGVDWGYEAPTAMLMIGLKDDVFYVINESVLSKKTQPELEEIALGFKSRYHVSRWYPDTAEQDRIEGFRRAGLYCLDVNKDIQWGITKVTDLLRTERLKILKTCERTIDEIERYHYPEGTDTKNPSENPVGKDDHAMDALRYALSSFQSPVKKPRQPIILKRPSLI